jgi:chloramphenicol 3-O-phosphotransferase
MKFFLGGLFRIILLCFLVAASAQAQHNVIALLGSSSAGKSTLAKELKNALGEGVVIIHYDAFRRVFLLNEGKRLGLLSGSYDASTGMQVRKDMYEACASSERPGEMRACLNDALGKMEEAFYASVVECARGARYVILDAFILVDEQYGIMRKYLGDDCFVVFVHISLEAIVARVALRNASAVEAEARGVNRVLRFYPFHYVAAASEKDGLMVLSSGEIARIVRGSEGLFNEPGILSGDPLRAAMLEKFELGDRVDKVFLSPRWSYNFLVDTSRLRPEEAADAVVEAFSRRES